MTPPGPGLGRAVFTYKKRPCGILENVNIHAQTRISSRAPFQSPSTHILIPIYLPCLPYNTHVRKPPPKSDHKKRNLTLFPSSAIMDRLSLTMQRLPTRILTTKLTDPKLKGRSYKRTRSSGLAPYRSLHLVNPTRAIPIKRSSTAERIIPAPLFSSVA